VSAALVSVPGASAFYLGGTVVYTRASCGFVADVVPAPEGMRGATEAFAAYLAESVGRRLGATWGLAETGATGPSGNPYGDPPGTSCLAVWGPVPTGRRLATGSADRVANMVTFAEAAIELLVDALTAERG
jgi:nicotinamide-nucleotide amidase